MDNPAAWHTDPTGRHEHRWWDGERWTEHVADAGQASVDPIDGGTPEVADGGTDASSSAATDDLGAAEVGGAGPSADPSADPSSTQPLSGSSWEQPGGQETAPGAWGQPGAQPGGQQGAPAWGQPGGQPGAGQPSWQQPGWQQQSWPQGGPGAQAPPAKTSGLAITALVLGILSLVFFWVPLLGGLGAVISIVFGFLGRSQAKKRGAGGAGMGIAGIIIGFVALILNILITLAIFGWWGDFGGFITDYAQCMEEHGDAEYCDQQLEDQLFRRFGGN